MDGDQAAAAPTANRASRASRASRGSWTGLIGAAMRIYLGRRIALLSNTRHWTRNTAGIQRAQLRNLLRLASTTQVGRKHKFAALAAKDSTQMLDGYRKSVPVADWYAYKSEFDRMREQGEQDVLWPGIVRDFAQTSGTTAGDKFIPVSTQMLQSNYLASLDIFAHLARSGVSLSRLLSGKSLFLGGSADLASNDKGIRTGDLSGIVTPLIRWPLTQIYLPGKAVSLLSHWPTKIEAMANRCVDEDVRMVSGMPSWALVLFDRVISLARERGRNVSTIRDVWPNFSVLVHGGVKYTPFDQRMRQVYSGSPCGADLPHRIELYPASEGFVAIQDTPGEPGLRLNADQHNFFEFVPLEAIDQPDPPAFTCEQVEKGQKYVVVLSTCAGLWRYILGDVVEFDSIPAKLPSEAAGEAPHSGQGPCRMRIVGRHRHFMNAFGENLIVEHIETAAADAARASGLVIGEFTAAPIYPTGEHRAGLQLAVELASVAVGDSLAAFAAAFDSSLKRQNVDYTTKRTDGLAMAGPTITPLPMGAFHRWLDSRGKLGGQHKVPRCANHRDIIDPLLSIAGAPTHATKFPV